MTLPNMRSPKLETWNASLLRFTDSGRELNETGELFEKLETEPQSAFMFVELLCNCWFLAELSVRFLVHPNKVCIMQSGDPPGTSTRSRTAMS